MTTMTHAQRSVGAASGPACATDPDLMFPTVDSESPTEPNVEERRALAVCARCSVLTSCRRAVLDAADRAPLFCGVAGGLTAAGRRAIRAAAATAPHAESADAGTEPVSLENAGEPRRSAGSLPTPPSAGAAGAGATCAGQSETARHAGVDELVARALAAHPASLADRETVRALALGHGPGSASRWEVALAAVVMLAGAHTVEAVARALGEDGTQLRRWRDRHDQGRPLVPGPGKVGTAKLVRPARLVHTSPTTDERDAA